MNLVQNILTQNDCYKAGRTITPKGIMVHSVGCAQPKASVFLKNWNKAGVGACVHAFLDDTGVYQTLPWAHRGWHAGNGTSGQSANNTHISFECCEPAGHTYNGGTMVGYDVEKNAAYFAAVYQNAVELCAMLCKQYGLDPLADGVLICHSEGYKRGVASNHADVMHWWPKHGKNMDTFRAAVAAAMNGTEDENMTGKEIYDKLNEYCASQELPAWAKEEFAEAVEMGITDGTNPMQLIPRYQAALMARRAAKAGTLKEAATPGLEYGA